MPQNEERLEHLCTQLRWRLTEYGECWYEIGVSDDGQLTGIDRATFGASMEALKTMCQRVHAEITRVDRFPVGGPKSGRFVAEVHIRPLEARSQSTESSAGPGTTAEIRVAFAGDSAAGKSTLIGVLVYGQLDNGRGDARLSLLRHRHEILSGRTTSVAVEPLVLIRSGGANDPLIPMRFDAIESTDHLALANRRLMLEAPKVLQFFDLPGHPKMHRSALSTLSSLAGPDLVCLVISAEAENVDAALASATEQLVLLDALGLETIIVLSKIDVLEDAVLAYWTEACSALGRPVFAASATTGAGINKLLAHLISASPSPTKTVPRENTLFAIESVKACEDIGLVLKGTLLEGKLDGRDWFVGPLQNGTTFFFKPVGIDSMQRLRLPVHQVAGQLMAAVAVGTPPCSITRGMLLVSHPSLYADQIKTRFTWDSPNLISGTPVYGKEVSGMLHCGCARVAVRASLGQGSEGLSVHIEIVDEAPVFLCPTLKLVLVTNGFVLAGRYQ
jgi:GTPase